MEDALRGNAFSLFTKLQLTQKVSNMTKADTGKVAATQNLLQGLRQARTKAPGAARPAGDYDPTSISPSDTFYEQLLDEVEKRLVALLPAMPHATAAIAHQQPGGAKKKAWKEAAGRRHGSEGYKFGDFSRSLFRKLR